MIVLLGSGGVGKTCLLHRFLFDKYNFCHLPTIEDDYQHSVKLRKRTINFTILDTAGSYQFPAMRKYAIQHGQGFIIVFAFDDVASLKEAKRMYDEVTSLQPTFPIVLVGNKIDTVLNGKAKLLQDDTLTAIKTWGEKVEFFESSAKMNHNVRCVFNKIVLDIEKINSKTKSFKKTSQLSSKPSGIRKLLLKASLSDPGDMKKSVKFKKRRIRLLEYFSKSKSENNISNL